MKAYIVNTTINGQRVAIDSRVFDYVKALEAELCTARARQSMLKVITIALVPPAYVIAAILILSHGALS